ncbi:leptin receptor [Ambystoma mexicanum]
MILLMIVAGLLHEGVIGSADILPAAYRIPPWDFSLSCALQNESYELARFTPVAHRDSSSNERHEAARDVCKPSPSSTNFTAVLASGKYFLCCFRNDTALNGSAHTDWPEMTREPSDTNASISGQNDLHWRVVCWMTGNMTSLVCNLRSSEEPSPISTDYGMTLLYVLSNSSREESSVRHGGSFKSAPCHCSRWALCECSVPSMELGSHYSMWLDIRSGLAQLQSPLLSVNPLDIVKPNPPANLRVEMTEEGERRLCWRHPEPVPYELQCEVKHSGSVPGNIWQVVAAVQESCILIGAAQSGSSSYAVQVRCKRMHGLGFWSDWSTSLEPSSQEVTYFPQKILTSVGSNASFYCMYNNKNISSKNFAWWMNLAEKIPEQQYTVINDHIGKVTLLNLNATKMKGKFAFDALYCCHDDECSQHYAEISAIDVNISISCETDGKLTKMTCRWHRGNIMLLEKSTSELRYYSSGIYCSLPPTIQNTSESKDCSLRDDDVYECIFQPIFPVWAYTMWIEITHHLGSLQSPPICVMPKDVGKPLPPSRINAEIAAESRLLNVSWRRPTLPVDDLRFQIQYSVDANEGVWQSIDILRAESAHIDVPDVCASYAVRARCRKLKGSGYWSDWSSPVYSLVKDIQVPLKGPVFWRIIKEDPISKQTNITLLWQPLMKNDALCNVRGYIIEHRASHVSWSEYVGNDTTYTFSWIRPVHTVTVLAINSIGSSLKNSNLTFSLQMSSVSIVHSLRVYLINNTCAAIFWTIVPGAGEPTSYVIEWENLSQEETIQWIHTPPNINRYYIQGHFIAIEKYRFTLYPVLERGICKPKATDKFSKDGYSTQNDIGMYVILPIIVLSSILLVAALLISHHRMKKMFWEDVPNPKNCSWAQGVNFQKPETLEQLFVKHHETLAFQPPFLLEQEISFEHVSVNKDLKIESKVDLLAIHSMLEKVEDPDQDSACASIDKSYQESTNESVKYAVIVTNSHSSGLHGHRRSISRDSSTRCLLGQNCPGKDSTLSNVWEGDNEAMLIFTGLNPSQLSKTSPSSTVSSEGFSEPSDTDDNFLDGASPESECYYLGIPSTGTSVNDFNEDPRAVYPCQSHSGYSQIAFLQYTSLDSSPCTEDILANEASNGKANSPYMPQFQTNADITVEVIEGETYHLET